MEKGIGREKNKDHLEEDRVLMRLEGGRKQEENIKLQGIDEPRVKAFKYGSTVQDNGGDDIEVRRKISAAWHRWKKITGVLRNKGVINWVNRKLHTTMVQSAMLHGRSSQTFCFANHFLRICCFRGPLLRVCFFADPNCT